MQESRDDFITRNMALYADQAGCRYVDTARRVREDTRSGMRAIQRASPEVYHIIIFLVVLVVVLCVSALVKMQWQDVVEVLVPAALMLVIVLVGRRLELL